MVSPDADASGSSTAQGWDFESALELIRFQTLALGLNSIESYDAAPAAGQLLLGVENSSVSRALPSLGNFEEVLKHFASPKNVTFEDEGTSGEPQLLPSGEVSIVSNGTARPEPMELQTPSDKSSGFSTKKQEHDMDSQDRRRVIHDLMGLSTDDRLAKRRLKEKSSTSITNKAGILSKGRDTKATLAGPDKKLQIMKLLFGDTKIRALVAGLSSPGAFPMHRATDGNLHIFVDISNILIGFHDALKRTRGIPKDVRIPRERLCFFNFSLVLERGRSIAKRVLAGSDDLESVEEARQMGYEVNLLQRVYKDKDASAMRKGGRRRRDITSGESESEGLGASRRRVEQGVDEILHLKILESIVDTEVPSVIVLASGDAAEAEYSGGFLRMVERALMRGWKVEVVAFRENLSATYRNSNWSDRWKDSFAIIELDPFAELLRLD